MSSLSNNNCITIREWQEREGALKQATTDYVPTTSVEIITTGAELMPVTTYADSDYVSPLSCELVVLMIYLKRPITTLMR